MASRDDVTLAVGEFLAGNGSDEVCEWFLALVIAWVLEWIPFLVVSHFVEFLKLC